MGLWATWSSQRCPCSLQGAWARRRLKVPSNPKHSTILCFCVSMILWFYECLFTLFTSSHDTKKIILSSSFARHVPWTVDPSAHRSSKKKRAPQSLDVFIILQTMLNCWMASNSLRALKQCIILLSSHGIWHDFHSNLTFSLELNRNLIFHLVIIFKISVICPSPVLCFLRLWHKIKHLVQTLGVSLSLWIFKDFQDLKVLPL